MKIVVLDGKAANPGDLSWDFMNKFGEVRVFDRTYGENADLIERIADSDVVLTNKTAINKGVIDACPNIKYIGVLATGYNVVDTQAAKEKGIIVTNIPAYSTDSVVQHTVALLLEITNMVALHNDAVHAGEWITCEDFSFWKKPLIELAGKKLGIIGYGQIGRSVGRAFSALGMEILVDKSHPGKATEDGVKLVIRDELFAEADVITLHCPLTPETEYLIRKENIDKMKDGVIILNTSRGGTVCEDDLADALRSGKVFAAAVDVVSEEPMLESNPLLKAPNCIITPHVGWAPIEARKRLMGIAEANLEAFAKGNPINIVNR